MATATVISRARGNGLTPRVAAGQEPSPRRLRLLLYSLLLGSSAFQTAIVPLLPDYAHRFGLSSFNQGMLLSATAFSTLAVSVPAGNLADRFGAKRLTLASAYLMALGVGMEALTPSFSGLLLARLVFGLGYGVVWAAGLAWLGSTSPDGSRLGGTVAASGVGGILGPVLAGTLGQSFGLGMPFWIGASAFVAFGVMLGTIGAPARAIRFAGGDDGRGRLGEMIHNKSIVVATAAIVAAGIAWSVAYLLVPEQLQSAGISSGTIGVFISAAAVVYVIGSTTMTSFGPRVIRAKVILAAVLALGLIFALGLLGATPVALVSLLCGSAVARAVLWTVAYPLAARGAEERGLGLGVVMGTLQAVWAGTAVVSPLLAGAAASSAGPGAAYLLAMLAMLGLVAVTVCLIRRRQLSLRARLVLERVGVAV